MIIFTLSYINVIIIFVFHLGNLLPKHWGDISVIKTTFCCDSQPCFKFPTYIGQLATCGIPDPEPKYLSRSLIYTGCCMHMESIHTFRQTGIHAHTHINLPYVY